MATYGFKDGKNKSDVYTKAEVDGLVDGIAGEVEAAITPTLDSMQGQIDTTVRNVNESIASQEQEIDNISAAMSAALATKQSKQRTASITLTPTAWEWNGSQYQQTVAVTGLLAADSVLIAPAPASALDYGTYAVMCSQQTNGYLTFVATPQPSISIAVNVLMLGV